MITTSTPSKGVLTDVHVSKHDPSFARESINGRFTFKDSMGTWRTIDDFTRFDISNFAYIHDIVFEEDTYLIGTARSGSATDVCILRYSRSKGEVDRTWRRSNADFNWNSGTTINGFIRKSFTGSKIFIYLTDTVNAPIVIDFLNPSSQSVPMNELSFSPKGGVLILELGSIARTGSLACGTYYYAIKGYKDSGLSTDWFMLPRSVVIPNRLPSSYNPAAYQQIEGGSLSEKSNVAITLRISNYSSYPVRDGWKMKVASFIALDEYTLDTGKIFYDGLIKSSVVHSSNNSYGDVDQAEVLSSTLNIIRCGDMTTNGELAVIGDVDVEVFENGDHFDNIKFLNAFSSHGNVSKIAVELQGHEVYIDQDMADMAEVKRVSTHPGLYLDTSITGYSVTKRTVNKKAYLKRVPTSAVYFKKVTTDGTYANYLSPIIDHNFRVYRRGEHVRFALLPFDLSGKLTRPIFLGDLNDEAVGNTPGSIWSTYIDGFNNHTHLTDGHFKTEKLANGNMRLSSDINNVVIKNVIMDDFYDKVLGRPKISGFSIVQAYPNQRRILSEGIAVRARSRPGEIVNELLVSGQGYAVLEDGWLIYHSPDCLYKDFVPEVGQKLVASGLVINGYRDYPIYWENPKNKNQLISKFYYRNTALSLGSYSGTIEQVHELPYFPETETINIDSLGDVGNKVFPSNSIGPKKSYLIKLASGSTFYNNLNSQPADNLFYVWAVRVENNTYGFQGDSDADLENSVYEYCGHYQDTPKSFFDGIWSSSLQKYVTDIYVYGGQYIPSVWDFMRASMHGAKGSSTVKAAHTHAVYIPTLTTYNIHMRNGNRHARNRISYPSITGDGIADNPNGIGKITYNGTDLGLLENTLLPPSYLNKSDLREVMPTPSGFDISGRYENVVFWTNKGTLQEVTDTFRTFFPSQYRICDRMGGVIKGLHFDNDKLYVLQENSVGYLPYEQKTAFQALTGEEIVMAYGDAFPRYELLSRTIGLKKKALSAMANRVVYLFNQKDSSIYSLSMNGLRNISKEKGVQTMLNIFTNPLKLGVGMVHDESCLYMQQGVNLFTYSITNDVMNGLIKLSSSMVPSPKIINFGELLAIASTQYLASPETKVFYEGGANPTHRVYDESSLSMVLGAESQQMKTFDTVQLDSDMGLLPKVIRFQVGEKVSEENLINGYNVLIHGPKIHMSVPQVIMPNRPLWERMRDYMVMQVRLSSDERFTVLSLSSVVRNNI